MAADSFFDLTPNFTGSSLEGMRLARLVLVFGFAMLSATFMEGCKKPTDDKKPVDNAPSSTGPTSPTPAATASPIEAVRARTLAYSALTTQMRSRPVTVDEACEFFTCDSLTTRGQVERVLKEQSTLGKQGWRDTSNNVPASRIKARPNGDVVALVETVSEFACQTPGAPSDTDGGVEGCKKARARPWKKECVNYVYTFSEVGGQWKRTGRADSTQIPCP